MSTEPKVVFISYSHDSEEHRERVLGLSERLRQDGFDTRLDRYVNGAPVEGWPRWMLDRLDEAAFVLVVCTETYYRRFRGHEQPDRGQGVDWEGALITQEIYDDRSRTLKFVPVLFDAPHKTFIPEPLRRLTHYTLNSDAGYNDLCEFLSGVAGIEPGPLGTPTPKSRRQATPLTFGEPRSESRIAPSKLPAGAEVLIGRDTELEVLNQALEDTGTHVVEFVAWGGVGKSALAVEWMTGLAAHDWPGIGCYFDWSFYSQGTREQSAVSADTFIAEALAFFGDPDPQAGSPHDRGNRLAELVAGQPTVLIVDGLEPLQYGAGPLKGQLKDPALLALLKGLSQRPFSGLCVVTTREELTDLKSFHEGTVASQELQHLTDLAGAAVLHRSGATHRGAADIAADDGELRAASREVNGHALTLSLLGGYLKLAHDGDIERRDRVRFEKADEVTQGGHAFRVVAAYEQWLQMEVPAGRGGDAEHGPRLLALLRLLGLFDHPASAECLAALRREPATAGLTDRLVALDEEDWNIAVTSLVELGLLSTDAGTLDAHPLLREYFADQLRDERSAAWTEGHRRLYEHLCETTEHRPDTLDGLQPLYQAVAHGCQAGLHQQACVDVYVDRILRGTGPGGFYSWKKLGAIGADLGAVACFFDRPWSRLSPDLSAADQAWLLSEAALRLRALGRLTEAVEPMRAGLEMRIEQEEWKGAAISGGNLSELELTRGEVSAALADAGQSVTFADRSGEGVEKRDNRTTHADALHHAGRRNEARRLFAEAETMQAELQPAYPRLYSLSGFQYCDLQLSGAERAAWRSQLAPSPQARPGEMPTADPSPRLEVIQACDHVTQRATQTLEWATGNQLSLLTIAMDHLTLGRAALYRWLAEGPEPRNEGGDSGTLGPCPSALSQHLAAAVDGHREAGSMAHLPTGLLTRAWQRQMAGDAAGAASDLHEAWEIAERGPMPLFQADILLTRARLSFRDDLATAMKDLAEARRLIEQHGYHRRDEELQDAEEALRKGGMSTPMNGQSPGEKQLSAESPVVFLSYSHDSEEHSERVRGLAASLARDGCDCRVDVYKESDEDWPAWMTRQLLEADVVLCVATQTYDRRFRDKEMPDVGLGVGWEAGLIRRLLYAKKLHNDRVFPIVFESSDRRHIPLELQGYDDFVLDGASGYEALLRKVYKRPLHARPATGAPPDLPTHTTEPLFARPGGERGRLGTRTPKMRDQATPLTSGEVADDSQSDRPSPALQTWQKKLEYLLVEEAKAADAAAKFKIQQDIEEARQKLAELGGDA